MVRHKRCPASQSPPWAGDVLRARMWAVDRGTMPVAGGLLEQTNWFVEACSLIDSERAAIDRKRQGEAERIEQATGGR